MKENAIFVLPQIFLGLDSQENVVGEHRLIDFGLVGNMGKWYFRIYTPRTHHFLVFLLTPKTIHPKNLEKVLVANWIEICRLSGLILDILSTFILQKIDSFCYSF